MAMAGDKSNISSLKTFFDSKVAVYNQVSFIKDDPICIPHLFSKKHDIEIISKILDKTNRSNSN
jgi:hypothetical protein